MPWYAMGLSIMATQASAITFISTTGQSYVDGMRFVQFYFGLPIAMVILCATAVPIFHRANVYTAYEYLETALRFQDAALVSVIFLIQRGLAAGVSIYAPAIVLSVILDWPDRFTTFLMGVLIVTYTRIGGIKAVTWADVQQMSLIFCGLVLALVMAIHLLPHYVSFPAMQFRWPAQPASLNAVTPNFDWNDRYNIWSGLIGGTFLVARLLRLRPIAGAALPHRQIDRAKPAEPALQRRGQDPDAVLHPVHRRHGLRVFHFRAAAAVVSSGGVEECPASPRFPAVNSVGAVLRASSGARPTMSNDHRSGEPASGRK